ncbi:MAG TPA: hypothetical protein VF601_08975 [Beijerinckiaceae bacterium]
MDDRVLEAHRKLEPLIRPKEELTKWERVMRYGAELSSIFIQQNTVMLELIYDIYKSWQNLRNSGVNVLLMSRSEARNYMFPPGHPIDTVLYVSHPAKNNVYYTAAQFHRMTFEHKFSEATKLLMALGATEINVQHVSGWSRDFSVSLTALLPQGAGEIASGVKSHGESTSQLLFRARLKGSADPILPADLVWYHHEPTWQQIAEGRLKFGLEDFALTVRYDDDYGVNAALKLAVEKSGFDLGGKFQDHQSTVWQMEGKFATN